LRLILRWVRERPFMLEHLAKITAVHPAATGWAFDEMLGLARWPLPAAARSIICNAHRATT
jgi:hypothetical protein